MRTQYERIAFALRTDTEKIKKVIENYDLFKIENERIYNESILRRLKMRKDKSHKARKSAQKRWSDANAMRTQCDGNAIKESKVKESKVNKRKVKEEVVFIPPIVEDVLNYFEENGYSREVANKAYHYYNNLGWKNSKGNQVVNWKNAMLNNWFKEENKKKVQAPIIPTFYY
jgi:hypothetical protein